MGCTPRSSLSAVRAAAATTAIDSHTDTTARDRLQVLSLITTVAAKGSDFARAVDLV